MQQAVRAGFRPDGRTMRLDELGTSAQWREVYLRLAESEHFPEWTSRLRLGVEGGHEAQTTLAVMERAFAEGWVEPRPPRVRSGRTVAVVGGGMVGLAAAAALNDAGHFVRVYESSPRLGGLLCVGRGSARVEQWVVDRRVELLEAEGVEFVTSAKVGETLRFDELREVSDALLLAIGQRRPRQLLVPGDRHPLVLPAERWRRPRTPALEVRGADVVILGDGPGAEHARASLHEDGAATVRSLPLVGGRAQFELDRRPDGGSPLLHAESAGEPDVVAVVAFEGSDQALSGVRMVHVDVGFEGDTVSVVPRPGSAFTIAGDVVVVAVGFVGPDTRTIELQLGVELDVHGNIAANRRFGTSVAGVYYAGDANPGASALLWDLSQGLEAAAVIDARLGS